MPGDHRPQPRRRFSALLCSERTRETPKPERAACGGAAAGRRFVCTSVDRRRRSRCSPAMADVPGGEYSLDRVDADNDRLGAVAAGAAQGTTTAAVTPAALSLLLHRASSGGGWRVSSLVAARASALGQRSFKKRACGAAGTAWTHTSALTVACPGLGTAAIDISPLLAHVSARRFSTATKAPDLNAAGEPRQFCDGIPVPSKSASVLGRPRRDHMHSWRGNNTQQHEHGSRTEQLSLATLETQAHRVYGSGSSAADVPAARPRAWLAPAHAPGQEGGAGGEGKIFSLLAEVEEAQAQRGRAGMAASLPMVPSPRALQGSFSHGAPLSQAAEHSDSCAPELTTQLGPVHSVAEFLVLNSRRLRPHCMRAHGSAGSVPAVAGPAVADPAGCERAPAAQRTKISDIVPPDSARSWRQRKVFIQRLNTLAKVYHPSMTRDTMASGLLFDSEADLQRFRSIESFAVSALEAAGDASPQLRSQWQGALSLSPNTPLSLSGACLAHRVAKTVAGTLPGTALLETQLPIPTLRARTQSLRSCLLHEGDGQWQRMVTLCLCSGSAGLRWAGSSKPLASIVVCHDAAVSAGDLGGCVQVLPVVWKDRVGHLEPAISSMLDMYCHPELFAIMPILGSMRLRHSLLVMGVRKFVDCRLDKGTICLAGNGDDGALERPRFGHFLFANIPHVSDEAIRSSVLTVLRQFYACLVVARKANLHRACYRLEAPRPGPGGADDQLHCLLMWIATSALDQQLVTLCCDQHSASLLADIARAAHRRRVTVRGMAGIVVRTYLENKHAPVFPRVLSLLEGLSG